MPRSKWPLIIEDSKVKSSTGLKLAIAANVVAIVLQVVNIYFNGWFPGVVWIAVHARLIWFLRDLLFK